MLWQRNASVVPGAPKRSFFPSPKRADREGYTARPLEELRECEFPWGPAHPLSIRRVMQAGGEDVTNARSGTKEAPLASVQQRTRRLSGDQPPLVCAATSTTRGTAPCDTLHYHCMLYLTSDCFSSHVTGARVIFPSIPFHFNFFEHWFVQGYLGP